MKEALFYEKLESGNVRCLLCNHFCVIKNGRYGRCGVRKNNGGVLTTLTFGNLIAKNCDPIEKKPLYHFLPGSRTYSIAAPGCNFQCNFCQNWQISQARHRSLHPISKPFNPKSIVDAAKINGCRSIAFTYTEPTVFYEMIKSVAACIVPEDDLKLVMVSNGFMSRECLDDLNRYIDAYNIDLKSFSDVFYRNHCGARLAPVLENIKHISNNNKWIEVTTLVIPGENDSANEIDEIAHFISDIDTGIPWHISRFFPNYKMTNRPVTAENILESAKKSGSEHRLNFVYTGNTSEDSTTCCPGCGNVMIVRNRFSLLENKISAKGTCPKCGNPIPGIWA